MPLRISSRGDWKETEEYLKRVQRANSVIGPILHKYGQMGVAALQSATPVRDGVTSQSWYYQVVQRQGYSSVRWYNSNVVDGRPVAILLQYGHATGTGGYVEGRDYIMPAIRPIFDQIDAEVRKAVTQ